MWTLKNETRFGGERGWRRDRDGVHVWVVAVKAAFDIKPNGQVSPADEQPMPLLLPEYHGDDGKSSLRYDADLVGPKPTTDVIVNGTAYAPNRRPSSQFLISLRLPNIHKVIKVVGNRLWKPGLLTGSQSSPEPVSQVPIRYEKAFGGFDQAELDPKKQRMDARNPVGCGLVTRVSESLPNFEYPSGRVDKAGPAGLGAIASYWSPRRELAGTYDDAWKKNRFPLLPADWDPQCLLCSPADQRPPKHLQGGEPVELENLTPDGKLSFALPRVNLRFRTRIDGRFVEHPHQLSTVVIEPDLRRVVMVWQSSLVVRSEIDYLDETVVTEGAAAG